MERPFEIAIYNKDFERLGWVDAPISLVATPRHNQQPTAALTVAGDDEHLPLLTADDSRVVCHYNGEYLIGGPVLLRDASGSASNRTWTFQIQDYWSLLADVLLYQVPGAALSGQSASEYDTVTGSAEYVVKTLLQAAITREGLPVTVATNLDRGDNVTVKARMDLPVDVLLPLIDQAGIGVTVQQVGAGLVLDCYEPTDWPLTLSEGGGTLTESGWTQRPPTVTSVVVGIGGEATAREYFGPYVNSAAEAAIGRRIQRHIDARDIGVADVDKADQAAARAAESLAAGAATAGLSLTLAETEVFRYGGVGVHVGDRVSVEVAPGIALTDVLREATLTYTNTGVNVTPVVGERRDDPTTALVRAVASLGRADRLRKSRS